MAEIAVSASESSKRLLSLDALRGFDMFWIVGGESILVNLNSQLHWPWLQSATQFLTEHVEWEGFHFYDLIFPLFLFIIGVTLPYSIGKRLDEGASRKSVLLKVLRRTALLLLIGWIYSGLLSFPGIDHLRIMGVLQRLALGYCFAACAMIWLKPKGQAITALVLLVVYWLIMRFNSAPGFAPGDMSQNGNFANYLDRLMFTKDQMYDKYGDPEGLLSTIPAFATALLGLLTGHWLHSDRDQRTKVLGMIGAGLACIALGCLWGLDFPIIKKLWTSSYVLVAGGASLLLLSVFYWLIDVKGWKKWAFIFVVIGLNPITIYIGQCIIDFEAVGKYFAGGIAAHSGVWGPFVLAMAAFMARWLVLLFLHRQKVYLRV